MELVRFLESLKTVWGVLSLLTSFFPMSDIFFKIVPTPPRREQATKILTTVACILVVYIAFISSKSIDRASFLSSNNSHLTVSAILGISSILILAHIFTRKDELENWKKHVPNRDNIPVYSIIFRYRILGQVYFLTYQVGITPRGFFPFQNITESDLRRIDDFYLESELKKFHKCLMFYHILGFSLLTASFTILGTLQYIQDGGR